jgi:hypothetical protein
MGGVFHSAVYGAMNKRQRRRLGMAGYRREEVWARMAAEEGRMRAARAALAWKVTPWWRKVVIRIRLFWPVLVRLLAACGRRLTFFRKKPRGKP